MNAITPFPGLENAEHAPRRPHVPQYAPVAQPLPIRPRNMLAFAANEVTAHDARDVLTKALGLAEFPTDCAARNLPLEMEWKRMSSAERVIELGKWILAEAYEVVDRYSRPVARPDHMNGSSE